MIHDNPDGTTDRIRNGRFVEPARDSRALFSPRCSRKADWEGMRSVLYSTLTPAEQEALASLPVLALPAEQRAFDACPALAAEPIEKLVRRGEATYYVNSEGYDYARYGFLIVGFPPVAATAQVVSAVSDEEVLAIASDLTAVADKWIARLGRDGYGPAPEAVRRALDRAFEFAVDHLDI